jgi:glycosyltransferase involved in cell wall biosynthesis
MEDRRVCFDARMAFASGIGTYIRGLLPALAPRIPLTLLHDPLDNLPGPWEHLPVASRFYSPQEQWTVPRAFRRSRAGLLHVPHYNIPVAMASRCVVTVHDLIHLKFPEYLPSRLAWLYAQTFFHLFIPRTRAILTVSEHTKKDLIELLGIPASKITVGPPGVSPHFRAFADQDLQPLLQKLGLAKGYFLYVGNLKEFKNVPRLLDAYAELKTRHPDAPPFVFVGRNFIPGFDTRLRNAAGVTWLETLNHDALPGVYAGARALVFPSLYEGFGLPPLEAMACGTPVITSNRASLPEVVGDAAIQIDPLSQNDLVDAMRRLWQTPSLARELSDKGLKRSRLFTWSLTAEKTLEVYRSMSDKAS